MPNETKAELPRSRDALKQPRSEDDRSEHYQDTVVRRCTIVGVLVLAALLLVIAALQET